MHLGSGSVSEERRATFKFFVPEDLDDPRLRIIAVYRGATIAVNFNDDGGTGTQEMGELISTMPKIVREVRQEIYVRREAAKIDGEARELLE